MEQVMFRVRVVGISDQACWYKNNTGKEYAMHEREDCFYLQVKNIEFRIKKSDVEVLSQWSPDTKQSLTN